MEENNLEQPLTKKERKQLRRDHKLEERLRLEQTNFIKEWKLTAVITFLILVILGGIGWFLWKGKDVPSPTPVSTSAPAVTADDRLKVVQDDWIKGNKEAQVTVIEYLDFECEACGAYYPIMKQLADEFKNEVRFINRYFPLSGHKNGLPAALVVEAAGQQGKYWEMHDALFENQRAWGEKGGADSKIFEEYAKQIRLDVDRFKKDVASKAVKDRVERDRSAAQKLGAQGTPTFFLNGEKIPNPKTIDEFKTLIKAAILKAPKPEIQTLGEKVHEHADFKVYLDGIAFDFTPAKYQSSAENPLDPDAHLHDGNGDIAHKHREGITLGYFFKTIGMKFDSQCFVTDDGKQYCDTADKKFNFYVNGKPNDKFGDYEFSDSDRILISYGSENETAIQKQLASVTDQACIYSEKCPERGKPPTENCVGGLGTEC